jgi:hypothetical protein
MSQVPPIHRKFQAQAIAVAEAIDRAIREDRLKAEWVAACIGVDPATLSRYRDPEDLARHLPAYLVPVLDGVFGRSVVLDVLAAMEGRDTTASRPDPLDSEDLVPLLVIEMRNHGQAASEIIQALRDNTIDPAEMVSIHAHAEKEETFWREIKERTSAGCARKEIPA